MFSYKGVMNSRGRNWCFTSYNVCTEPFAANRDKLEYLIYGRETCPQTRRKHLQGFVVFKVRTKFTTVKNFLGNAHIEKAKGTCMENAHYCKKDGDFVEFGQLPTDTDSVSCFKDANNMAKAQKVDDIAEKHPGIFLRYKRTLDSLVDYSTDVDVCLPNSCGVWIFGPPRCGKDFAVRELGSVFNKPLNKWFDGYKGESNILISDLEPDHGKWIGHFLKIWADRYPIIAEIKGGSFKIRPKRIYVTSNYSMNDCFSGKILEALITRFNVYDFSREEHQLFRRSEPVLSTRVLAVLKANELISVSGVDECDHGLSSEVSCVSTEKENVSPEEEDFTTSPLW